MSTVAITDGDDTICIVTRGGETVYIYGKPISAPEEKRLRTAAKPEQVRGKAVPWVMKKDGPHKFSSTQFNLDDAGYTRTQGSPIPKLQALQDAISDFDLAADGKETGFHVTVKYGLHTQDWAEVERLVRGFGTVYATLGRVSLFEAKSLSDNVGQTGPEYDVVKVDVDSPDLHRLNALLATLPHTDTHPEYHPHVTLAYVRPGLGLQYLGGDLGGHGVILQYLMFSNREGEKHVIDLIQPVQRLPTQPLKSEQVRAKAFNPDQPRDDHGRFGSVGDEKFSSERDIEFEFDGLSERGTTEIVQRILGKEATLEDTAQCCGALPGSRITFSESDASGDSITLKISHPQFVSNRRLGIVAGKPHVSNESFHSVTPGAGWGAKCLLTSAKTLEKFGGGQLVCYASGNGRRLLRDGREASGFYAWPRLGYDGNIPAHVLDRLPSSFKGAVKVSDLMVTPEGRDWWRSNGSSFTATFDVREGSQSRQVLASYLAEKGKEGQLNTKDYLGQTGEGDSTGRGEEIELTALDEQILDRVWDRLGRSPSQVEETKSSQQLPTQRLPSQPEQVRGREFSPEKSVAVTKTVSEPDESGRCHNEHGHFTPCNTGSDEVMTRLEGQTLSNATSAIVQAVNETRCQVYGAHSIYPDRPASYEVVNRSDPNPYGQYARIIASGDEWGVEVYSGENKLTMGAWGLSENAAIDTMHAVEYSLASGQPTVPTFISDARDEQRRLNLLQAEADAREEAESDAMDAALAGIDLTPPPPVSMERGDEARARALKELVGRDVSPEEIHQLAGGIHGCDAEVMPRAEGVAIRTDSSDNGMYTSSVTIGKDGNELHCHYDFVKVEPNLRDTSLSSQVLANQLKAFQALGVTKVDTIAARGGELFGYKVWPRYGFDAEFYDGQLAMRGFAHQFRGAKTLQELYAMPGGRREWEKNGFSIDCELDLTKPNKALAMLDRMAMRKKSVDDSDDLPTYAELSHVLAEGKYLSEGREPPPFVPLPNRSKARVKAVSGPLRIKSPKPEGKQKPPFDPARASHWVYGAGDIQPYIDPHLGLVADVLTGLYGDDVDIDGEGDTPQKTKGEWEESKHPRATDGKFGSGGGSAEASEAPAGSGLDEKNMAKAHKQVAAILAGDKKGVPPKEMTRQLLKMNENQLREVMDKHGLEKGSNNKTALVARLGHALNTSKWKNAENPKEFEAGYFGGKAAKIDSWGEKAFAGWSKGLDDGQREALVEYTNDSSLINDCLRKQQCDQETNRLIPELGKALDSASLPEAVKAYRGLDAHVVAGLAEGGMWEDKSFASTSLDRETADGFTPREGGAMMILTVPKGAKAAYLNADKEVKGENPNSHEQELLLQKGVRYQVDKIDKSKTPHEYHMTVLPYKSAKPAKKPASAGSHSFGVKAVVVGKVVK